MRSLCRGWNVTLGAFYSVEIEVPSLKRPAAGRSRSLPGGIKEQSDVVVAMGRELGFFLSSWKCRLWSWCEWGKE